MKLKQDRLKCDRDIPALDMWFDTISFPDIHFKGKIRGLLLSQLVLYCYSVCQDFALICMVDDKETSDFNQVHIFSLNTRMAL